MGLNSSEHPSRQTGTTFHLESPAFAAGAVLCTLVRVQEMKAA